MDPPDEPVVRVERPAAGGTCVGRHPDGRVVFVRHCLPGELVRIRILSANRRFYRAEAVEVLEASPERVSPPCPHAGPGRCGGCDWQHAALDYQRRMKAQVVAEQLRRLAGLDREVTVEAVPGDSPGLGWRSRVQFGVDPAGRVGLHRWRSHDLERVSACAIASPGVEAAGVEARSWPGARRVEVAIPTGCLDLPEPPSVLVDGRRVEGEAQVHHRVGDRSFRVTPGGFWQVHTAAAALLVEVVLGALEVAPGQTVADLYCGAGLFSAFLGQAVGERGRVLAVEQNATAAGDARANTADLPQVSVHTGRVDPVLVASLGALDRVVLDPPRTGAGPEVVTALAGSGAGRIAYVACDPASLARDLGRFRELGWELAGLRAFDLFPMTEHVEALAVLAPAFGGRL